MPHIIVEYSANMEERLDMRDFLQGIHEEAISTGVFAAGGIRTRGERRDLYIIADGDPANGFVHVTLMIGHGRSAEVRRKVCEKVFAHVCRALQEVYDQMPLAISLQMKELEPDLIFRKNNIHKKKV